MKNSQFHMILRWGRVSLASSLYEIKNITRRGKEIPLPPSLSNYVGGGNTEWHKIGAEFVRYFVDWCSLQPQDSVLDAGCGYGRMAAALTDYLSPQGSYEGFDISRKGIKWCRRYITSAYPNFHFQHVDVRNNLANPAGQVLAREFEFPYADATFDFVFLTSVFTHMLPEDVEHYLSQIARVLKPGGRCLITYFILNDESLHHMSGLRSHHNFQHERFGYGIHYAVVNPEHPESALAYDEDTVRDLHCRHGLPVRDPIRYGYWSGREETTSFQDIVIATKPST